MPEYDFLVYAWCSAKGDSVQDAYDVMMSSEAYGFNVIEVAQPSSPVGPFWTSDDRSAALSEGWDIFDCQGSASGPWQLQSFDDPEDVETAPRPYPFQSDLDAWKHVRSRAAQGSPLHERALAFLAEHNLPEYRAIFETPSAPAAAGDNS